MFKRFTNACVNLIQKYLPDPFIFCIILTVIVFVLAMPLTHQGPIGIINHWGNGVWSLLSFAMQMALVLVLGNAMATSPPMQKLLKKMASIPKNAFQSIVFVTLVALVACWINWGFGLIVGAILAKEIAKQGKKVDYRLLIASAYSGFIIWHGGFSGSIPLAIANVTETVTAQTGGVLLESIPSSQTIFSPFNLIICILLLIFMPLVNAWMHPDEKNIVVIDPKLLIDDDNKEIIPSTPAEKLENNRWLSWIVVGFGVVWLVGYFIRKGFALDLNVVNLIFLTLGVALHKSPIQYVKAIGEAVKGSAGILLQFPFYAGIMGIMVGSNPETGVNLAGVISHGFVTISNEYTFPLFSFFSAGIVNFFIPSGGGQWAVQGPIMMPAGAELGISPALTAMSIAWGDAWTNMIQPFWALPALGIAKLGARDIMGFCVVDLLVSGIIICLVFLLVGLF
ncbi:short-chain fatty acid transporter [Odoribacter sp. OttesenSCG-928-L07]|nr:short-chain fatty acid transporter [Odoribacter sp. OttesenSCG-928-L07]MDL2239179.1 short-chain fatty acid transporter [Bacteroidales bacterium OttesenSCG-928-L14]MDL2240523.1 short-chain fatty acid transporter [Bacteroidales bacterium OttesenSCG-928-K22]